MSEKSKNDLDRPVSLKQLAEELGFHPSSMRKAVVSRGFTPFRLSEGQNKRLYLKATDAESLRQHRENELNNKVVSTVGTSVPKISGVYFIEVPSYEGKDRIKIGWSDNLSDRLSTYRTVIPDLRVKAVWQTSEAWCERAALKCAEGLGRRVHQELFEFEDNDTALFELSELFLKLGIKNKHEELGIRKPAVDSIEKTDGADLNKRHT